LWYLIASQVVAGVNEHWGRVFTFYFHSLSSSIFSVIFLTIVDSL